MTPSASSPFGPPATLPSSVEDLAASVERLSAGAAEVDLLLQPPAPGLPDRWYVSDGSRTVGPVDYALLSRGVHAGAVGQHCWLRNEAWRVWRRVAEFARVQPTPGLLPGGPGGGAPSRGLTSSSSPLPTRPACVPHGFVDDDGERTLVDVPQAELPSFEPLLGAAIVGMAAEACLLIEVGDQGGVVRAARGAGSLDVLGEYIPAADPVLVAAAGGAVVLAEPWPGPVGATLLARLARCGCAGAGALMVPIFSRGRRQHLAGILEVGRTSAFGGQELAQAVSLAERAVAIFERLPATVARTEN